MGTEEKPEVKGFDEGCDFPEESRTNPDQEVTLLSLPDNATKPQRAVRTNPWDSAPTWRARSVRGSFSPKQKDPSVTEHILWPEGAPWSDKHLLRSGLLPEHSQAK